MDNVSSVVAALKEDQQKQEKKNRSRMCYVPHEGYTWNPFSKYPTNLPCICGSGNKFKKCCRDKLQLTIEKTKEKEMKEYITRMIKYVTLLKSKGILYKIEEKKKENV